MVVAAVGEMSGKALKGNGKAERDEMRGGESLDAVAGTSAGCRTGVGAAVVGGTRRGACSECGVTLPLRLLSEEGEGVMGEATVAVVDAEVVRGAAGGCCWRICRLWVRWAAAGGEPKAEPQARWLSPEWASL